MIQTKNTYKQKEFYFSCANLYNIFEHWEVSLAYDFQWNTLDATFYMPTESDGTFPFPTRYTHMAALATAFEWGRLKMQASVLGYFVHEKVERFEARPDKAVATPAFFGSFKVLKNHDLSVRAFYKRMFRMPTFNDLYYTDMGNAFLKPEYAEQFNVGLKYTRNFEKSPFMRMLDVSVDAYYNKITDKIIAYPKGQQFRWTMLNLGEVEIKGVDAVLNALFTLGKLEVTTKFQYTYQKAIDITDPADTYYRDQIPYIPWHSGSAILALFYKGWGLNYSSSTRASATTSRRTSRATTPNRGTRATSRCKRLSRSAPEPSRPRPRLTIFSDRITTWCSTIRCRRPTSGSSSASISNLREP